jgi:hypothetical protein
VQDIDSLPDATRPDWLDLEHLHARTGLGLALARAVAEGHGGAIAAYSALGQGSRFELTLPLATPAVMVRPPTDTCWRV